MTLPVVVACEAQRHASTIDRWWRANRGAAPDLFRDEFAAALELIGLAPFAGRLRCLRAIRNSPQLPKPTQRPFDAT